MLAPFLASFAIITGISKIGFTGYLLIKII